MFKLYNEDCRNTMKNLKENSVDYVITSPPYNRKRNDKYKHFNDICDDYYLFLVDIIDNLICLTRKTVFFNIAQNYYNRPHVLKILGHYSNHISEIIIWEKTNPLPAQGTNLTNAYEFFICFGDRPKAKKTYTKNIFKTSVASMPEDHKAVMHIDACRHIFKNFIESNSIIFDPFLGTGTTAICAHDYRCNFIGSELSTKYFLDAKKRIEQHQRQLFLF